jgi:hypothetical protein
MWFFDKLVFQGWDPFPVVICPVPSFAVFSRLSYRLLVRFEISYLYFISSYSPTYSSSNETILAIGQMGRYQRGWDP